MESERIEAINPAESRWDGVSGPGLAPDGTSVPQSRQTPFPSISFLFLLSLRRGSRWRLTSGSAGSSCLLDRVENVPFLACRHLISPLTSFMAAFTCSTSSPHLQRRKFH